MKYCIRWFRDELFFPLPVVAYGGFPKALCFGWGYWHIEITKTAHARKGGGG